MVGKIADFPESSYLLRDNATGLADEYSGCPEGAWPSHLEARDYRLVSLDEVMRDAAYATRDTWVDGRGTTWLWRWMKSKGMSLSFADDPEVPAWVQTMFDEGR